MTQIRAVGGYAVKNMELFTKLKSNLQLAAVIVLLIGLIASVSLVLQPQTFRSRAYVDITGTLQITGDQEVNCSGNVCTTESDTINIQLNDDPNNLFSR